MSVNFDCASDFYDDTRGLPPGEAAAVGALFRDLGHLTPQCRVLEIGIGTGRIALPVSAHAQVFGVDISHQMLLRLLAKRANAPVYPARGDATRLPFSSGAFDAAFAIHIFHLIPDWQTALREVARALKPGGALLHGWNDSSRSPDQDPLWQTWNAIVGSYAWQNIGVPRAQYHSFLADSGWRKIGDTRTHTFRESQTAAEFLAQLERRVWSSLWRVPDDVIAAGLDAVRALIRERAIDLNAPVEIQSTFHAEAYHPPV
jgi:ubiquinone/menaquinone biosynthesis C-methylase UbiE